MEVFDKNLIKLHRNRATKNLSLHDFLIKHASDLLSERLNDFKGNFDTALDFGCRNGSYTPLLNNNSVKDITYADISEKMLAGLPQSILLEDFEFLPLSDNSFDLITSVLNLHNINDLPGVLIQINKLLKPDGVFLANMFGPETLKELRNILTKAEIEQTDGVSPRIHPFADVKTLGSLLQRAGFKLPVSDSQIITVHYRDVLSLIQDIRGMGEANSLIKKSKPLTRNMLSLIEKEYKKTFSNENGEIIATFEIIFITGLAAKGNK